MLVREQKPQTPFVENIRFSALISYSNHFFGPPECYIFQALFATRTLGNDNLARLYAMLEFVACVRHLLLQKTMKGLRNGKNKNKGTFLKYAVISNSKTSYHAEKYSVHQEGRLGSRIWWHELLLIALE